jgi:radical SAM superfamily enzyme YgiQ (UPF0313 family)
MIYSVEQLNPIFEKVEKPGRYTGGEFNQIIKDNVSLKFALCFPDLYEIGMANNGIQILYDKVNKLEFASCERVFTPAQDFAELLVENNLSLYTLETKRPLYEFDILGFNISYELLYTNILYTLELGGLPLLAEERDDSHPLIIGGGEAVSNPAPMHKFIDLFFVGEGENGIIEICNVVNSAKVRGKSKHETLLELSEIDGVFVPSRAGLKTNSDGFPLLRVSINYKMSIP